MPLKGLRQYDKMEDRDRPAHAANDDRHPVTSFYNPCRGRHNRDWGRKPPAGEVLGRAPPSCLALLGGVLQPSQFEILVLPAD